MKTIDGAFFRASAKSVRMRAGPRPANISTNEDALCAKKRAPVSFATAFATSVLPVPGGPWKSTPFGTRAPSASKRAGSRRKSAISCSSSFASSRPATSPQVTEDAEPGVISVGLIRGISLTIRQRSQTTMTISSTKMIGIQNSTRSDMKVASTGSATCVHERSVERFDGFVNRCEPHTGLAPCGRASRGAGLVEPARCLLDEDDRHASPDEASNGDVGADAGADAEQDDLLRLEQLQQAVGIR